jgi:hypothetical protein
VWLDEQELQIGDSLSGKMDQGLSRSRYGVVILSPAFFAKHWPKKELAGLRALEDAGRKVILPIWHNVDKATVARFSPPLADSFAANSDQGMFTLAAMISKVVFQKGTGSPSAESPSIARRFVELLESTPSKSAVLNFLKHHFRYLRWQRDFHFAPYKLGGIDFDGYAAIFAHRWYLTLVTFTEVWQDPFEADDQGQPKVSNPIESCISAIKSLQRRFGSDESMQQQVKELFPVWVGVPDVKFFVFAGRRRWIDATQDKHELWSDLLRNSGDIEIRSYDHILDRMREVRT